jgi:hypothetical protein
LFPPLTAAAASLLHHPAAAEVSGDKGGAVHEFTSLVRELAAPGSMTGLQSYAFKFSKAELPHESYDGINAVCRYYIKATVGRTATLAHAAKEAEFTVQNPSRGALTAAAAGAPAVSGVWRGG